MTKDERRALAESLIANPLWTELFEMQERHAIEPMIYTDDQEERRLFALRVQVIRALRHDCEAMLRNTEPDRGAFV